MLGGPAPRLAEADQRLGLPSLLPTPPAGQSASAAVRAASGDEPVTELVVVHPSDWQPGRIRDALDELYPLAEWVRSCTRALALAREVDARSLRPPGPLAVLEVDPTGVGITVLADPVDGAVLAGRFVPGAPRLAESLAGVAGAAGCRVVELTGGVLLAGEESVPTTDGRLAELIDLAGQRPVLIGEEAALATLGGLRVPRQRSPARPSVARKRPARSDRLGAGLLPDPPPPRRLGPWLLGFVLPALCALIALFAIHPSATTGPASRVGLGGVLAQYDYALVLPAGWRHSGGLPARRRTLLTPVDTPNGSALISVEQTLLGYDSVAEFDRARRELEGRFAEARAGGDHLDGFTVSAHVGGREVIAYRQHQPRTGADVDWYVLFDGDSQLSVGCQHTYAAADAVRTACAEVLASLRLRPS